jgi:hypothetical protein
MAEANARQITLRLSEPLYEQIRQLARKRRVSINKLAQESLAALAENALAEEMRAAYEAIADPAEESEVGIFFPAQREVVLGEPA